MLASGCSFGREIYMTLQTVNNHLMIDAIFAANAAGFKRPKAIRYAHGILSPGAYINNRVIASHPDLLKIVIDALDSILDSLYGEVDIIASVATGGIVFGSTLAWINSLPHVIVKKQEKGHGLGGLIDGDVTILADKRVLLVEDMSTTFESSLKAMEPLKEHGATVVHTLMIETWNFPEFKSNVKNHGVTALCTGSFLFEEACSRGIIDQEHEQIIRHWLEYPEDETWANDGKWILPDNK